VETVLETRGLGLDRVPSGPAAGAFPARFPPGFGRFAPGSPAPGRLLCSGSGARRVSPVANKLQIWNPGT
jgi:hypothetical protein